MTRADDLAVVLIISSSVTTDIICDARSPKNFARGGLRQTMASVRGYTCTWCIYIVRAEGPTL